MPSLTINDISVNYVDAGAADEGAVVALHCSSSTAAQWRALWERIGNRYRVFAPNLMGYGGSGPWIPPGSGNGDLLTAEAAIVYELAERAGGPVYLIGHSYGGSVAVRAATDRPEAIAGLVLIEPMVASLLDSEADAPLRAEILEMAETYRARMAAGDADGAIRVYIEYWNGPGSWDAMGETLQGYVLAAADKTDHEFAAIAQAFDHWAPIADAGYPVLILRGEATRAPTRRMTEILAGMLPRASLATVPGAGHMSPITHADAVNAAIEGFLVGV